MDYEQKYKETLERAKTLYDNANGMILKKWVEQVFPELSESEDEMIRKAIIDYFNLQDDNTTYSFISKKDIINWLEKQGSLKDIIDRYKDSWYNEGKIAGMAEGLTNDEKYQQGWHDAIEKQGEKKSSDEVLKIRQEVYQSGYNDGYKHGCEDTKEKGEKPIDKVEPKFKVGDWIVENGANGNTVQITKFEEDKGVGIRVWFSNGTGTYIDFLKGYHLWTIQDAKEGDVLCYKDEVFLYKHDIKDWKETSFGGIVYYCCYDSKRFITDSFYSLTEQDKIDIHLATKEQRDLLFQKMKEAGYEWDEEKKELMKIVQKTADKIEQTFYEGDWIVYKNDICQIVKREKGCNKLITVFGIEKEFVNERNLSTARLWTVSDAKDGDVLAYVTDEEDLWIMIYQSLYEPYEGHVHYHALLINDNFSDKGTCCICIDDLKPATKEQRDLLFQKMKEARYKWDKEKKELSEIKNTKEEYE